VTIATILGDKGADIVSISPDRTVADAVVLLAERRIGAVPVLENGKVTGVFSERDVIRCLQERGSAALGDPVRSSPPTPDRRAIRCSARYR